jgi:hypothetical protein
MHEAVRYQKYRRAYVIWERLVSEEKMTGVTSGRG